MAREYKMGRRAEQLAETRRRIVDATVSLHEEVGPARTTVTAIAQRAKVSRPTVYSQFPDDRALFAACSSHFRAQHPLPELVSGELEDSLAALYAYFAENRRMLENVDRDARLLPALAEVYANALAVREAAADDQAERLAAADRSVRAIVRLAFTFDTWRQLDRSGLSTFAAAALMTRLARAAATR